MRLGLNSEYKLPDYIPTRGHLMLQNQKISKSRNWYIGLKDFTSTFNPDYLRFYIASVVTYSQDDLNFDFDAFYERITTSSSPTSATLSTGRCRLRKSRLAGGSQSLQTLTIHLKKSLQQQFM